MTRISKEAVLQNGVAILLEQSKVQQLDNLATEAFFAS